MLVAFSYPLWHYKMHFGWFCFPEVFLFVFVIKIIFFRVVFHCYQFWSDCCLPSSLVIDCCVYVCAKARRLKNVLFVTNSISQYFSFMILDALIQSVAYLKYRVFRRRFDCFMPQTLTENVTYFFLNRFFKLLLR